jgi:hypothetical protein
MSYVCCMYVVCLSTETGRRPKVSWFCKEMINRNIEFVKSVPYAVFACYSMAQKSILSPIKRANTGFLSHREARSLYQSYNSA